LWLLFFAGGDYDDETNAITEKEAKQLLEGLINTSLIASAQFNCFTQNTSRLFPRRTKCNLSIVSFSLTFGTPNLKFLFYNV